MHKLSLGDISYETGLKLLVMRKYALDKGDLKRIPKEKLAETDLYTNIDKSYRKQAGVLNSLTPEMQRGLIGAGVGAGLGSLAGVYSAKDKDKKTKINKGLSGGLSGAALLGGLGFISPTVTNALSNLPAENKTPELKNKVLEQIKNLPNVSLDEKQKLFDASNVVDANASQGFFSRYINPALRSVGMSIPGAALAPSAFDKLVKDRKIFQRLKTPDELITDYATGLSLGLANDEKLNTTQNLVRDLIDRVAPQKGELSKINPGTTSAEVIDNLKNLFKGKEIRTPEIRDLMAKHLDIKKPEDFTLYKTRDVIEGLSNTKGRRFLRGFGGTLFGGAQIAQEFYNAAKQREALNEARKLLQEYDLPVKPSDNTDFGLLSF